MKRDKDRGGASTETNDFLSRFVRERMILLSRSFHARFG